MQERERTVATGLLILLLVVWGGFVVHRSPAFPGSLTGSLIGIAAAVLMFVPFLYLLVKRLPFLRSRVTRRVSMRTLLAWHIYAGLIAPILALVHSGHRFDSAIGTSLTFLMLLAVLSGFTGRYLMRLLGGGIREKQQQLASLKKAYLEVGVVPAAPPMGAGRVLSLFAPDFMARGATSPQGANRQLVSLVDAIASLEYAIKAHEAIRTWFRRWLRFHITLSMTLYVLLLVHIYSEIHFGLRWL